MLMRELSELMFEIQRAPTWYIYPFITYMRLIFLLNLDRPQSPLSALSFGGTELGRALESWKPTRLEMPETIPGEQDPRLRIHC